MLKKKLETIKQYILENQMLGLPENISDYDRGYEDGWTEAFNWWLRAIAEELGNGNEEEEE